MKYFTFLCFVALLTYLAPFNYSVTEVCADTQPEVVVECGKTEVVVYENLSDKGVLVHFWAVDKCEGGDSELKSDGQSLRIKDGTSIFGSFSVPKGGKIELDCRGRKTNEEDGCTFIILEFITKK